jgi:hypothetical protein
LAGFSGSACYVVGARNPEDAKLLGGDPDKPIPSGMDAIDPKPGEPMGIDEGWGYMPGNTISDAVTTAAQQTQQWDYTLAKAFMQDVPAHTRDALATAYRNLPSVADDTRRYAQRVLSPSNAADIPPYRTLGLATSTQAERVRRLTGAAVDGFDFALDAGDTRHIANGHMGATEIEPGQDPVSVADFALLPRILNDANATWTYVGRSRRAGHPIVSIVARLDGQAFTARWEVLKRRRMLALKTFFKGKKP